MFKKIWLIILSLVISLMPICAYANRNSSKPSIGSQVDWSHPLAKSLVGCWLMNENGGLKVNDLVNKNNGTNVNSLWRIGKDGYTQYYNGTNAYTSLSRLPITGYPHTLYSVFSGDVSAVETNSIVITDTATDNNYFGIAINPGNYFVYYFRASSTDWITYGSPIAKEFYAVAGVSYAANKHILYVNNIPTSSSVNAIPLGLDRADLGSNMRTTGSGNVYGNGKIQLVYIWNRALSPSEIQQLYQDPYCFIKPPTIWSMFSTAVAAARRSWTFD